MTRVAARSLARRLGVPLAAGTEGDTPLADAEAFLAEHGPMMIKAVAGGGGRGMRPVRPGDDVAGAWERSRSEAEAAFGSPEVYVERLLERARHVEVQIIGDGSTVTSTSVNGSAPSSARTRRIVEIAPSPSLDEATRTALTEAAVAMAAEVGYRSLGTWEFLVEEPAENGNGARDAGRAPIAYLETNARLQVEHTVTEEVTGLDLVRAQLQVAAGASLADVGLAADEVPSPRGHAIQVRVNTETMTADGTARPAGGTLTAFEAPTGPGIRSDTYGYVGYTTNPAFDSLLAKVIGHAPGPYADAVGRVRRALGEFRLAGVDTNIGFLQALLDRPEVVANDITTAFVTDHAAELIEAAAQPDQRYFAPTPPPAAPPAPGPRRSAWPEPRSTRATPWPCCPTGPSTPSAPRKPGPTAAPPPHPHPHRRRFRWRPGREPGARWWWPTGWRRWPPRSRARSWPSP